MRYSKNIQNTSKSTGNGKKTKEFDLKRILFALGRYVTLSTPEGKKMKIGVKVSKKF